jgi:integrase
MDEKPPPQPEILPPGRGAALLAYTPAPPPPPQPAHALGSTLMHVPELAADDPLYAAAVAANRFIRAAKAPATVRAYAADWRHFTAWCSEHGLASLPATPDTVALYLADLARGDDPAEPEAPAQRPDQAPGRKPLKVSTIARRLTVINAKHKEANLDAPARTSHAKVASAMQGIRRTLGSAQTRKRPLTLAKIQKLLDTLEGPIAAARDKALLLVGFVGGLRRSELAAIRVEHLGWHRTGCTIQIPWSKTDQEGKGREIELPFGVSDRTCPCLALENWLTIANIKQGFVLRRVGLYGHVGRALGKDSIGRIIQRLVRRARLAHPEAYAGHSLRAGFVTEAARNGASDREIMRQTGHKSRAMIDRYARAEQQDRQAAVRKLGV